MLCGPVSTFTVVHEYTQSPWARACGRLHTVEPSGFARRWWCLQNSGAPKVRQPDHPTITLVSRDFCAFCLIESGGTEGEEQWNVGQRVLRLEEKEVRIRIIVVTVQAEALLLGDLGCEPPRQVNAAAPPPAGGGS